MSRIDQLLTPPWAPAYFVTVDGSPVLARQPIINRFQSQGCQTAREPYYDQRVFMPDYPYFKRWQCRANAYGQHSNAANGLGNIYYQGLEPSAPRDFV